MENPEQSRLNEIHKLLHRYCKKHLDDEYLRLCNNLIDDLLEHNQNVFKLGKAEIWAASIIWAIGSINFLGDKTFDPYASLSDICSYFKSSASTVGQKASKIREWFDIDYFDDYYQREDLQFSDLSGKLVLTEDGFIVPREWLQEEDNEDSEDEDETVEELPDHYLIIIDAKSHTKHADLYQLEYLFKTVLSKDEYFEKIEMSVPKKIYLYFYGRPAVVISFEKKLNKHNFLISDVKNNFKNS